MNGEAIVGNVKAIAHAILNTLNGYEVAFGIT